MGILGDKMVAAGVVSKEDAARVKRQMTIEKEHKRKMQERSQERAENDRKLRERRRMEDLLVAAAILGESLRGGK